MSQQLRRVLAAFGLMAALFLGTPASSEAAGLQNILIGHDLGVRIWAWIEGLLPEGSSPKPSSTSTLAKEGSGINPNGVPQVTTLPSTPPATTSNDGSLGGKQ
jgi:hypothetical protein